MLASTRQTRRANVAATHAVGEMIRAVDEMIRVEMSRVEMSRVEMSRVEMSRVEMSRVETNRVEMIRVEMKAFRRVKRLLVSRYVTCWSNCCRAGDEAWSLRGVSLKPRCVKGALPRAPAPKPWLP